MSTRTVAPLLAFVLVLALEARAQEKWDKDLGKPAPRLFPAGWVGSPVSLDALRKSEGGAPEDPAAGATVARGPQVSGGNTVVLAFWNADIPC